MCNYKTLYHSESGYAVKCGKCGHIQLAFGTTAMAFTIEQFNDFRATVGNLNEIHRDTMFRIQKSIQIPAAAKGLMLVYNANELEQLHKILEAANDKLGIEKLLTIERSLN